MIERRGATDVIAMAVSLNRERFHHLQAVNQDTLIADYPLTSGWCLIKKIWWYALSDGEFEMSASKSSFKPIPGSPAVNFKSVAQALVVGECLSFRGAAKVLGIRQSAVSRRVRALEDKLGVSLFERHPGGVRITNAGARFLQQAHDGLLQLDNAVRTAGAAGRGAVGRLNIGILSSMASGFLRELIEAYSARHPDVSIQVHEGNSTEQIALIRRRQLDVAFVVDATGSTDCDVAPLWKERLFVVLPHGHVLCDQKEVEWEGTSQGTLHHGPVEP